MVKKISFIQHNKLFPHPDDAEAAKKAVLSGQWACGRETEALEKELAEYTGYKYCVAVASGSAALRLALLSLGVGPGDKVIMPAYSCVCLANATLSLGAEPLPADIRENSLTIDPKSVRILLCKNVKAIIAVDTFGAEADLKALAKTGIPVIQDFSHGFKRNDPETPKYAKIAICSMYATKFLAAGEGGFLVTDDFELSLKIRDFRDYTDKNAHPFRYNDKITDIEAAIARSRLGRIDDAIKWRKRLAEVYDATMRKKGLDKFFHLPDIDKNRIWYRYAPISKIEKIDNIINMLEIGGGVSISCARPVEKWHQSFTRQSLPVTENAFERVLSLPFHPGIGNTEVIYISEKLATFGFKT